MAVTIITNPVGTAAEGDEVRLEAQLPSGQNPANYDFAWAIDRGILNLNGTSAQQQENIVFWNTAGLQTGGYKLRVTVTPKPGQKSLPRPNTDDADIAIAPRPVAAGDSVPVTMRRTAGTPTKDLPLWLVIRRSSEALSFDNFITFMDLVLCGVNPDTKKPFDFTKSAEKTIWQKRVFGNATNPSLFARLGQRRFLPYNDSDAYRLLKIATEAFVTVNCAVTPDLENFVFTDDDVNDILARVGVDGTFNRATLNLLWKGNAATNTEGYLQAVNGFKTILYLKLIRDKLPDVRLKQSLFGDVFNDDIGLPEECFGILQSKLTSPCLLELIWSYWHEEGMLVQTLNTLSLRFQNIRGTRNPDPLAMFEIDPLRPLNNLIWGYIQDEQHRLSVVRRTYEYDHHYGLGLQGRAVPNMRPADSRSKFLEAFHNLLYLCWIFFKEDDDTTVIADGFPVLNALKDVHLLLAEGAHNQFGDLPSTARQEMLLQQWLLARPEFREFLPTRTMVAYPERWMDRVDAMKTLQGWTDVSVLHFSNLGTFGERILLSIRFGAWSTVNDPNQASNWARFWRAEIQGYVHAYRAVTAVDLTTEVTDSRQAMLRSAQPSLLLTQRLASQRQRVPIGRLTGAR